MQAQHIKYIDVDGDVWRSTGHGTWTAVVSALHGSNVQRHCVAWSRRSPICRRIAAVSMQAEAAIAADRLDACIVNVEAWLKASRLRLNPRNTQAEWLASAQQMAKVRLEEVSVLS